MPKLTQAEMYAFNVLKGAAVEGQAEAVRRQQALDGYIGLLEFKHKGKYNPATGEIDVPPEPRE